MDPTSIILSIAKKYWWVLLLIVLLLYTNSLKNTIDNRDKTVKEQVATIALLQADILNFKSKIDAQNKAIEELTQKGKEQALRLESAIAKVNAMKPATQVIIREIYSDKTKDIEQLLLNAVND